MKRSYYKERHVEDKKANSWEMFDTAAIQSSLLREYFRQAFSAYIGEYHKIRQGTLIRKPIK